MRSGDRYSATLGMIPGYPPMGQRLAGEEIDKAHLAEGYCGRFCSSQIAVFPNTLPEQSAVHLTVRGQGAVIHKVPRHEEVTFKTWLAKT